MLWKIKKGIRKQKIIDPKGNTAGFIIRKGHCFEVANHLNECVLRIEEKSPLHLQFVGEGLTGSADIDLCEHNAFTRPPMAEQMRLTIGDTQLCMKQSPTREFTLFRGTQETGWITGMPCMPQILVTTHSTFDYVSLLYILAYRMYHEDDVDIV